MVAFRMSKAVLSVVVYLCIPWLIVVKSSQDDIGKPTTLLDLHLEMKPGSSSVDLKDVVHDEIQALLKDCNKSINKSVADIVEARSPLAERSTDVQEKLKLDKISAQLQSIEKLLQEENDQTNKGNVCTSYRKALGVNCDTCNKNNLQQYPKNCKEVLFSGKKTTGIYEIHPRNAKAPFPVLCDMETRGGGWTHIQKRFDGSQDFFLEWRHYKFGFGDLAGEFWMGLEKIYFLTDGEPSELLVEIVDRDNVTAYAHYSSFGIGPEKNGYALDRLSGFSGDAGDSLTAHLGEKFSAKDLDFTKDNCATLYPGGWWYKACHISNLNGKFINVDLPAKLKFKGLHWKTFRSHEYCHSKSRMLVRPAT